MIEHKILTQWVDNKDTEHDLNKFVNKGWKVVGVTEYTILLQRKVKK